MVRGARVISPALAFLSLLFLAGSVLADELARHGDVRFVRPAGWLSQPQAAALVLRPALAAGAPLSIQILASRPAPATLEEGLDGLWREAQRQHRVLQRAAPAKVSASDGVDGLASVGVLELHGQRMTGTVAAYIARGRLYGLFIAGDERAVLAHGATLRTLIASLRLEPGSQDQAPPSSPYALIVHMPLGATPAGPAWTIGANTVASALFTDGTWMRDVPGEGLDGFDAPARRTRTPSAFGQFELDAVEMRLQAFGRTEVLVRQHDGTFLQRGSVAGNAQPRELRYFEAPSVDALRLDGRYGRFGQADGPQAVSLVFRPDGTFEDRGLVGQLAATEIGVRYREIAEVTQPGSGSYRIANHTLFLDYADGRRKRVLLVLTPEDANSPRAGAIYLGAWCVRRLP